MRSFLIMYLCVSCVCAYNKTFASDLFGKAIEKQEEAEAELLDNVDFGNTSNDDVSGDSDKWRNGRKDAKNKTESRNKKSKKGERKTADKQNDTGSGDKSDLAIRNSSKTEQLDKEPDEQNEAQQKIKDKKDLFGDAIEKQEEAETERIEEGDISFDKIAQVMVNSISSSKRKNKQLNSLNKRLAEFRNDTDENAIFSLFLGLYNLVGASIFSSCFQKLVADSNFKQEVSNLLANLKTKILSGDLYQGKNAKTAKTLYDVIAKHL